MKVSSGVAPESPCVCGHSRSAHEHYRRGTDCALCSLEGCAKFTEPKTAPTVAPVNTQEAASLIEKR